LSYEYLKRRKTHATRFLVDTRTPLRAPPVCVSVMSWPGAKFPRRYTTYTRTRIYIIYLNSTFIRLRYIPRTCAGVKHCHRFSTNRIQSIFIYSHICFWTRWYFKEYSLGDKVKKKIPWRTSTYILHTFNMKL